MRYEYTLANRDEQQLHDAVVASGLPGFLGICGSGDKVEAVFEADLTESQVTTLNGIFSGYVLDATLPTKRLRTAAKDYLDNDRSSQEKLIRALAFVIMDELNILRQNPTAVLAPRTAAQLKAAIRTKLDAGDAD